MVLPFTKQILMGRYSRNILQSSENDFKSKEPMKTNIKYKFGALDSALLPRQSKKSFFNKKKIENLVEKVSGSKTYLVTPLDILLNNKSNVL